MRGRLGLNCGVVVGVAALLITVLAAIPDWVGFLEARGYDAAWLLPSVRWVQRWWWVIVALIACGLVAALVWRFREALGQWEWGRQRYVRALSWLATPVRDELAVRLAEGDVEADWRERVGGLSNQALTTLRGFLRAYRPTGSRTFAASPGSDTESGRDLSPDQKMARYGLACAELKENGFISDWRVEEDDDRVVVTLARSVRSGLVLRMLDLVNRELGG